MKIIFECAIPRAQLRYRGTERAAVLLGSRDGLVFTVRRVVVVPNASPERSMNFEILAEDVRYMCGDSAGDVIGVIHSHPHGLPNPSDNDLALLPEGAIGAVFCGYRITGWYMHNRPLRSVQVVFPTAEWAVA